ncbi:hypothetical protein GF359_01850 [candidate division WOR-3 bacterium]|uniref:DNA-(apurinic or apyrimidinic site) lyase n=1 Tax=candidate division WOR-3 bacterium TaxID=2052148 RepID=A0A9D5K804_UNCW3|nr:hypothetical protein [candidate division WOR-3 bacterium]MBD3363937.1 hypothetical protein [candidate division WOR-3 bacterium]
MAFELPESIVISSQMDNELKGKKIEKAYMDPKECASQIKQGFINLQPPDFEKTVTGKTIRSVTNRGKGIYVQLEKNLYLVYSLETSGYILYHTNRDNLPPRWNTRLDFTDGTTLTVKIIAWGFSQVLTTDQLKTHKYLGKEEISLIDENEFTFDVFNDFLESYSSKPIKFILIRQGEEMSGIGNGYLQDILFKAKIHPKRKARDIPASERKKLYKIILKILTDSVKKGGRDTEFDLYGNPGGYRVILDKRMKDQPCPKCGTTIQKSNILGSTCYVCPECQK